MAVSSRAAWACGALLLVAAALGPVVGDHAAFRYTGTGLAALAALWWLRSPGSVAAPLTRASFVAIVAAAWVWAFSCGASHFLAFEINGVDFSIFEWQVGSTHQGHFGYSRIYEVNHFGVHSTFLMLLLVPVHAVLESPWVLLVTGASLIWAGVFPVRKLARWANGGVPHGGLELAAMVAWLANPWLGKLLNSGFRIESFMPVLTAWFLVGWVEKRRWVWAAAMVGLWCSKEDTTLFLAAFALGALLVERTRWREAATVAGGSLLWLLVYLRVLQPALLGHPPLYTGFWSELGDTLPAVALGMLRHPLLVARKVFTSGWWTLFVPALFVPMRSVRAMLAMAPTLVLLGAATNDLMHALSAYYPVPLVPFMLFGALEVWRLHPRARWLAALSLLTFPLFWGGYGRVVPVNGERLAGFEQARAAVATEAKLCAQNILFPHLGVDQRLIPMFETGLCIDPTDIAVIVNPQLDTWPHEGADFTRWLEDWKKLRPFTEYPGGFVVLHPAKTQRPPVP